MNILAIETSFDETAVAVISKSADEPFVQLLSSNLATSAEMHKITGGVVPENAAREQLVSILPVLEKCLADSGFSEKDIDAIAVTQGPGLIGSLLVGVETAKTLSLAWDKPLIPVHHLAAHLWVNFMKNSQNSYPQFPLIGMVVSGGHTDIVYAKSFTEITWIGGTRDDAAGECFDKCARILLNASYPGGPAISAAAKNASSPPKSPIFPRPMIHDPSLEMSFSGLKTATHNLLQKEGDISDERKNELAYDLEQAIVEVLMRKLSRAVDEYSPVSVVLGGGVLANWVLRDSLKKMAEKTGIPVHISPLEICSDNAIMIGAAASLTNASVNPSSVFADPRLPW